jgi:hypothetical protein
MVGKRLEFNRETTAAETVHKVRREISCILRDSIGQRGEGDWRLSATNHEI